MDPSTREPVKIIPCELCGSEAKLLCFCRKCSLCESCIGKHLINEPTLAHKPVTFSQSEIAAQYEREFTEIREHEQRLIAEVSLRQEELAGFKTVLKLEMERLEQFKCTCLEYVALAVQIATQKIAHVAESIGKEMVDKCESKRLLLDQALSAIDNSESHDIICLLKQGKKSVFEYKIDLKDINPEEAFRAGIDFHLEAMVAEVALKEEKSPSKADAAASSKTPGKKPAQLKHNDSASAIPIPSVKPSTAKAKPDTSRLSQTFTKKTTPVKPSSPTIEESKSSFSSKPQTAKTRINDIDTDPSPGPPLIKYQSEVPSSSKSELSKSARTHLLNQTAKSVLEISAMVQRMKSPSGKESNHSFGGGRRDSKSPREMGRFSPLRKGEDSMEEHPIGLPRLSLQVGMPVAHSFSHLPISHSSPQQPSTRFSDESKDATSSTDSVPPPSLFSVLDGTTQLVIHDLSTQTSSIKSFEGIEPFLKHTFWCLGGREVYILGGVGNESLPSTIKKTCWIFSPDRDTMEQGPNMLTQRFCCSAVCFKDTIYVSGGIGMDTNAIKDSEKLDLKTRKWRKIGNLNVPRESHAMTEHLGRLYVAGGPGVQQFETYNPVNDRWALLHIKANAAGKATMFSAEDRIVILHDKWLMHAWVDKRQSQDVLELAEKGWWTGGIPVRHADSIFLLRASGIYSYSLSRSEFAKVDNWPVSR